MSAITTHVLDTSLGRPAAGVPVTLKIRSASGTWKTLARARTDADGRVKGLLPAKKKLKKGVYRLTFETAAYHRSVGVRGFYPAVTVTFAVREPRQHHHVPLLLSPHGYSTYRGS